MSSLSNRDILDPRSRHNRYITTRDDLVDVPPWSAEDLYQAVTAADQHPTDQIVVLDYGRSNLYLVAPSGIKYTPPDPFGLQRPPVLAVTDPKRYDPSASGAVAHESVLVAPEFDLLIPAFDWEQLTAEDTLPPVTIRPTRSSTGADTPG